MNEAKRPTDAWGIAFAFDTTRIEPMTRAETVTTALVVVGLVLLIVAGAVACPL